MKEELISRIEQGMLPFLNNEQLMKLQAILQNCLFNVEVSSVNSCDEKEKGNVVERFIAAKHIEGCSDKTMTYYRNTIDAMVIGVGKKPQQMTTDDLRQYLLDYQARKKSSKVTIDNIRRILYRFISA